MGSPVYHNIRKRVNPFSQGIVRNPVIPPPQANNWWWNPGRPGIQLAPEWFQRQLREFDPTGDLQVTWNQYAERWQVFYRVPKFQAPVSPGWKLLFIVKDEDGGYRPLDERIFARLYQASTNKWANGRKYWEHLEAEMARDREKLLKTRKAAVDDSSGDYWDYMQIKNIGSGSKFANHHAG